MQKFVCQSEIFAFWEQLESPILARISITIVLSSLIRMPLINLSVFVRLFQLLGLCMCNLVFFLRRFQKIEGGKSVLHHVVD